MSQQFKIIVFIHIPNSYECCQSVPLVKLTMLLHSHRVQRVLATKEFGLQHNGMGKTVDCGGVTDLTKQCNLSSVNAKAYPTT